jgi:hypothetical protein
VVSAVPAGRGEGLEPQLSNRRQFWNRLPESVCDQIVQLALAQAEKSAR